MQINLSEAKTNLSNLVNRAYQGEKITIAKHNLPMVDLVVHQSGKRQIKKAFGLYQKSKVDGVDFQEKMRNEW